MYSQIIMAMIVPAVLFLGVAGSGIYMPPSKDEDKFPIRLAIKHIWAILAGNGLLFGLGTHLYLVQGASILFWCASFGAFMLTIVQMTVAAFMVRRP